MKTWETKNGCKVIRVLSGRSNVYLILNDKNSVLVDTGKKSTFGRLRRNLDSLNIPVEKIDTLILTHTHFDHCQSAKKIQEKSGCRIIVSEAARDNIQNGFTKLPKGTFFITTLLSKAGNVFVRHLFGYEPFQSEVFVNNDITLRHGSGVIRIIGTKGHSDDSVSILVDNEIAIVGDAMFGIFQNSIFPPFADDISKTVESWKALLETDCILFLPGHGGEIPRNRLEKQLREHIKKSNFNSVQL